MTAESMNTQEVFKRRYVDPLVNAVPQMAQLQRMIGFDTANRIGEDYRFPILLRYPHGHTWTGGSNYGSVQTLNTALAGLTKQTSIKGCEHVLRAQLPYGAVSKGGGGETSFEPMVDVVVESLVESAHWALELTLMHGGGHIGALQTVTPGAGTDADLVITIPTWAPGCFSAFEGGQFDLYDSTLTTKQNTGGPITINSIDIDARELAVTFFDAGDRTAATAGDVIVPLGAFSNWQDGLVRTISQAAAGATVYGLSTATYGLLKSGTYSAGSAALTFAKVARAAIRSVTRGGAGDLVCLVSHYAWTDINNDEAALRRYGDNYGGDFTNGAERLTYYGPQGGKLDIVPHSMMKAGEAVLIDVGDWRRIGSSEPTFNLPNAGETGEPMFVQQLAEKNGYEIRNYWDQGPACRRLGRQVHITDITNLSGP